MKVSDAHSMGQSPSGPWGIHTSTLEWCEDNYAHFAYIAEAFNTLSNIPFVLLGLAGIYYTAGLPHRSRYALPHAGVAFIGVGSAIFHSTMSWWGQVILDELPMLFVAAGVLYIVLSPPDRPASLALKLGVGSLPVIASAVYLKYDDPVFHQVVYGIIQVCTTLRTYYLQRSLPHSASHVKRESTWLTRSGSATFLVGFAIWNIDNLYCLQLTDIRHQYAGNILVDAATQGHAWWHILTGLGSCRIITGITRLHLSAAPGKEDAYEVAYKAGWFPYVRTKQLRKKSE